MADEPVGDGQGWKADLAYRFVKWRMLQSIQITTTPTAVQTTRPGSEA